MKGARKQQPIEKRFIEIITLLAAILVPLLFNPYTTQPIEAGKVMLLYFLGCTLILGWVVTRVIVASRPKQQLQDAVSHTIPLQGQPSNRIFLVPVLVFLAICILATIFSINPKVSLTGGNSYQGILTIAALVILFMMVVKYIRKPAQVERITSGILVGSLPVAVYGCVQFFGFDPLQWQTTSTSAVHSTVGYSLYLGSYLAMVVPFSLQRIFTQTGEVVPQRRAAYTLLLILLVACIVFTRSRGALISLVIGSMLFLGMLLVRLHKLSNRWTTTGLAVILVMILSITATIFSGWIGDRVGILSGEDPDRLLQNRQVSNSSRLALWRQTLPVIANRSWLGYGPGTFDLAFTSYYPDIVDDNPLELQYWDTHNLFLNQLASAGLLGLATFLIIVGLFYWKMLSLFRRCTDCQTRLTAAAILSSASAYLVHVQFNPSGIVPAFIFWLVMALGIGMASAAELTINNN